MTSDCETYYWRLFRQKASLNDKGIEFTVASPKATSDELITYLIAEKQPRKLVEKPKGEIAEAVFQKVKVLCLGFAKI